MKRNLACVAASALVLAACQTPPMADVSPDLLAAAYPRAQSIDERTAADFEWEAVLTDPRLRRLTALALDSSRSLRLAVLDAQAAQAQLQVQRAGFWPQFSATGDYTRGRLAGTAAGTGLQAPLAEQAGVGLGLTAFELDLFGRVRAQSDSAFAAYLAAEEGASAARIALIATVAEAYVATLAANEQASLTEASLTDWRQSLALTQALFDAGRAGADELALAQAQVKGAEAELEGARRAVDVSMNALTLAVGSPLPEDLPPEPTLASRPILTELPAGTPSDLLTRRPDIRAAEHQLTAAKANVRAARAAFFPQISLTGALGFASGDLDDLFDDAGKTWSFAPRVSLPIFDGGRLKGQLDLAAVRSDSAVAAYELTVQRAFAEVADRLAGRATFGRQIAAQDEAVSATERRHDLAEARYKAGASSRLELLDAQRALYASRQTLVQLRAAELTGSVNLYRALGGGLAAPSAGAQ